MDAEKKRLAKENEEEGDGILKMTKDEKGESDDEKDEAEDHINVTWKQFFKNIFLCKYIRGGSGYEQINIFLNVLSLTNIIFKVSYDYYASKLQLEHKEAMTFANRRSFAEFDTLFVTLRMLNYIDCIIFILLPVSFMKQLITWVPDIIKSTTDLLKLYLNKKQFLLWLFSLYATFAVAMFNKFVMSQMLFKVGSNWYAMLRTMMFNLNGFFWERSDTFGIGEDVNRVVTEKTIVLTLFCILAIRTISAYIVFNIMVS